MASKGVVRTGGLFGKVEVYLIWYEGKFKNSNKSCTELVRVTEKEYEKQIYGD